jgi:hypothetical protein
MNRIRILHLAGAMSLVGACVVTGLCVLGMPQPSTAALGSSSTIMDRLKQVPDNAERRSELKEDSALVRAAKEFAVLLSPPAPAKPALANPVSEKRTQNVAKAEPQPAPENTSAKFELRGISYHRSRPEESMALVAVPGAGISWVRQGTQIGRITIDKISGDSIECRDGERVLAMSVVSQKTTAVAKAHDAKEKKLTAAATPKSRSPTTTAGPRPLLVRGMRQIPPVRVAASQSQDTLGSSY